MNVFRHYRDEVVWTSKRRRAVPSPVASVHSRLGNPAETSLVKLLAGWPRLVESPAEAHEPHRVAFHLYDVAAAFHGLWNKGRDVASLRFLVATDAALTAARLALVQATATIISSGFQIMGVTPVEEMR
jgi:arginyl-tRNA synthetase